MTRREGVKLNVFEMHNSIFLNENPMLCCKLNQCIVQRATIVEDRNEYAIIFVLKIPL